MTTTSTEQSTRLLLASTSPARKKILTDAGIVFDIMPSEVDEDRALAIAQQEAFAAGLSTISPAQTALLLAKAKSRDVAGRAEASGALVLGCDSVFELDGQAFGKPKTEQVARERITAMSGRSGVLHTGHWLVDPRTGAESSQLRSATVHFAQLTEAEIDAYVATGEPLWVAGSFTIDGFGAAFITGIEGEFHTVVGLSVNALREMLRTLGADLTNFWKKSQ